MGLRIPVLAIAYGLTVGASAQQPPDIVGDAARAIVAHDIEALEAMRFTALDFHSKRITVAAFLAEIEDCEIVAEHRRGTVSMAHEIHYDCPVKPDPPIKCAKDTLVVAIDRATSPDVTAYLQYHPLDKPECQRPRAPSSG